MKYASLVWAAALMFAASPSSAASLCNCCGATTVESCSTVCAPLKIPEGQCTAAVDYESKAKISKDSNPLYDVPLRSVWLGSPKRAELESFRRLLETARRNVERDRRASLREYTRRQSDRAALERSNQRYDDAVVNYFLGIESYRAATRAQ